MKKSNLIVLKFGGSSLTTPDQIRAVAKKISELRKSGNKLIVVTSAMGKTTDQLNELARKVSAKPNRRELDMLLTTGERVSMALMAIALQDFDCPAISYTGSQAGIMTDGAFSSARIKEIKPIRVEESLHLGKVVVLAGFQGVDPTTKEITTLGRGGSDTTAVAMASHFGASRCEILKDVDGVMSADPQLVDKPKIFNIIHIDTLYEFCFWGAKVLNHRSVELARDHRVPLVVGRSDNFKIGTEILNDNSAFAIGEFLGVNSHKYVIQIEIQTASVDGGLLYLKDLLSQYEIIHPHILSKQFENNRLTLLLAIDQMDFDDTRLILKSDKRIQLLHEDISTVTSSYWGKPPVVQIVKRELREEVIRQEHRQLKLPTPHRS